jgi:hypothetical protein
MKDKAGTFLITVILILLFTSGIAFADDDGIVSPFGPTSGIFRSGIYVISEGSIGVNNSYEESLAARNFGFNYSIDAAAEKGHAVFYNTVSSVPFGDSEDRLIRTGTIVGYDNQGTDGVFSGKEAIGSAICSDEGGAGLVAGVGYDLTDVS